MFLVFIVVDRVVHQLGPYGAEDLSFLGLWSIISQNLTCRIIAYLQVLLMYFINDEEITVLYVLAIISCQTLTII